jgi:DNA-binding transcriptional LysR family regulator
MIGILELRSLDYFLAVAEKGSLRAAAQQVGVTQPALTKAIRRLEDTFGVPLFDRRARGMALTAYGAALLRHVADLRGSLQAASEEVAALRTGLTGVVTVGAGPYWQDVVLPDSIRLLREARPGIKVLVVGGSDDQMKTLLSNGTLDMVLGVLPETPRLRPEFTWRHLLADEYCVIADENHPLRKRSGVTLEDLLAYPWILPAPTTNVTDWLRRLVRAQGLPPPEPAVETDLVALKYALMRGSDYLSVNAAAHLRSSNPGFLVTLDVPGTRAPRQGGLITRRGIPPSPAAAALTQIIVETCGRLRSS